MLWILGCASVQVLPFHPVVRDLDASGWASREPKQFGGEGEGAPGAEGDPPGLGLCQREGQKRPEWLSRFLALPAAAQKLDSSGWTF